MTKLFAILWRLSILLLPWQTRWFWDASVAGWPWEQGRVSLYVSWFVLLATMVVGWRRDSLPRLREEKKILVCTGILFILSLLATGGDTAACKAVMQWWAQILLLGAFVFTLRRSSVSWTNFATWFVIALLPHALLGFIQYATQRVEGSMLLGIATHFSETPGTSVVEHGIYRVLRIYGGFPHPNIFGGWLVVGILTALGLAVKSEKKSRAMLAVVVSALLSVALLLTYSRSAWLACVCGVTVLFIHLVRTKALNQYVVLAVGASLLAVLIVGASQRDHLFARANTASRLETMSIDARRQSLRDGWGVFQSHALVGTGPNADLLFMGDGTDAKRPLEPPHSVILLALVNFGILGCALLAFLVAQLKSRRAFLMSWSSSLIYLLPLFVIGMFDHYLWSLWAGQTLVAIAIVLAHPVDPAT
jgi:O-antigen ligase